jgi:hypothetical protein
VAFILIELCLSDFQIVSSKQSSPTKYLFFITSVTKIRGLECIRCLKPSLATKVYDAS